MARATASGPSSSLRNGAPPPALPRPVLGLFEGSPRRSVGSFVAEGSWRQKRERARHWTHGNVRGSGPAPRQDGAVRSRLRGGSNRRVSAAAAYSCGVGTGARGGRFRDISHADAPARGTHQQKGSWEPSTAGAPRGSRGVAGSMATSRLRYASLQPRTMLDATGPACVGSPAAMSCIRNAGHQATLVVAGRLDGHTWCRIPSPEYHAEGGLSRPHRKRRLAPARIDVEQSGPSSPEGRVRPRRDLPSPRCTCRERSHGDSGPHGSYDSYARYRPSGEMWGGLPRTGSHECHPRGWARQGGSQGSNRKEMTPVVTAQQARSDEAVSG